MLLACTALSLCICVVILVFPEAYDVLVMIMVGVMTLYTANSVAHITGKKGQLLRCLCTTCILTGIFYGAICLIKHLSFYDTLQNLLFYYQIDINLYGSNIISLISLLLSVVSAASVVNQGRNENDK